MYYCTYGIRALRKTAPPTSLHFSFSGKVWTKQLAITRCHTQFPSQIWIKKQLGNTPVSPAYTGAKYMFHPWLTTAKKKIQQSPNDVIYFIGNSGKQRCSSQKSDWNGMILFKIKKAKLGTWINEMLYISTNKQNPGGKQEENRWLPGLCHTFDDHFPPPPKLPKFSFPFLIFLSPDCTATYC